jgi:hypothetical protein
MTATAETRVLPETLDITWERLRKAISATDSTEATDSQNHTSDG